MVLVSVILLAMAWAGEAFSGETPFSWEARTLRLIEPGGAYGRMVPVPGKGLIFVCERARGIWSRQSRDAGKTWSEAQEVAIWKEGKLANPELLLTREGTLLCFHNRRPGKGSRAPYAIAVSRLEKGAGAWSAASVVFEAGRRQEDGCWEPAAVQLPSGEVQLFFANEAPYRTSSEQEIALMRSNDNGRTWSAPERAGFRAGHRDGMPVPVVLNNGAGIAVAIEDTGLGGAFKPAILFTRLTDAWRSGTVTAGHPGRWGALAAPLPPACYAGAPYLRQMADGTTVLAFQRSEDGDMMRSRIAVGVGDAQARGFGGLTYPFPETPGAAQLWAGMCVKDERTVTVLGTLAINGAQGVWSIDATKETNPVKRVKGNRP